MELLEFSLLMLAAVLLSSVIDQLVPKVSSPLIQIGLGLLIALVMGTQISIAFDPNLFLVLFIAPVSYTHLDVYKRQTFTSADTPTS